MNQDKSKEVVERMALNRSEAVNSLLVSMLVEQVKTEKVERLRRFEKQLAEQRISIEQLSWIMNRSVTL